jgi:glutathione S-transferase
MRMTLLYQTHSPFARKVLVFAHERGLADQLKSNITKPALPTQMWRFTTAIPWERCLC